MSSASRSDSPPPQLIVTLTTDQLASLIREQVEAALAEHREGESPTPRLRTLAQAAREIGISDRTLRTYRDEGMPHVLIGTEVRYEIDACVAWIRQRRQP